MPDAFQYDVFLSHSAKDKAVVRAVAERLRKDGLKVWFDEWVLKAGDSIPAKIEEGLEHSRVLVLCMSAHAFGSDWAQLEAGTFRFRDPLNKERRFIPLRLDDAPIKGSLAQFLCINWLPKNREMYAKLLAACQPVAKLAPKQISALPNPQFLELASKRVLDGIHMHPQLFIDRPLLEHEVVCGYAEPARPLAKEVKSLIKTWLPKEVARQKAAGRTVDNNLSFSLRSIRIERPQLDTQDRLNRPELIFEPSDYFTFIVGNLSLDKPLLKGPQGLPVSLRQCLSLDFEDFDWGDIMDLGVHTKFGTVVAVITADDKLIVALRSRLVGIRAAEDSSSHQASLSCAEGMLRPVDVGGDGAKKVPNPFQTAKRALAKELGIHFGDHYLSKNLRMLGLGFDKERAQPIAVFMLTLETLTFNQVVGTRSTASDHFENKAIFPVNTDFGSMIDLIEERHSHAGRKVKLFSNHQIYGAWVYASYRYGTNRVSSNLNF